MEPITKNTEFRLLSRYAELRLAENSEWTRHLGREFYKVCLAGGHRVTVQQVLAGKRYVDSKEAEKLFRPNNLVDE